MKKLPTPPTMPKKILKVWPMIAPPLEASAPAPGRLWVVAGPGAASPACQLQTRLFREVEIAGVDAVFLQERFDVHQLRLDRVAERAGLLGDGGAAEDHDTGQDSRQRHAHDGEPQRVRQLGGPAEQVGHGVEGDTEQHAGKDQEQRRREGPGEQQQGCEQHDADAADGDCPRQIVAGLKTVVSGSFHVDSFASVCPHSVAKTRSGSSRSPRRFDAGARPVRSDGGWIRKGRRGRDEFQVVRALALLAALVIGDQIRINRPGHKYRLAIEVETPDGVRSASSVVAVHPDRSYSRGGRTRTAGDAVYRRSRRGQKSRRAARACRRGEDRSRRHQLYGVARLYRGLRCARLVQSDEPALGAVPVNGALIPVLVSFADPANPGSARTVSADDAAAALGAGLPPPGRDRRSRPERLLAA